MTCARNASPGIMPPSRAPSGSRAAPPARRPVPERLAPRSVGTRGRAGGGAAGVASRCGSSDGAGSGCRRPADHEESRDMPAPRTASAHQRCMNRRTPITRFPGVAQLLDGHDARVFMDLSAPEQTGHPATLPDRTQVGETSQGQRSPRLKVTASKGRMHIGSLSFALAISTHSPSRSSNASRVWSVGSTNHRCRTPSRA